MSTRTTIAFAWWLASGAAAAAALAAACDGDGGVEPVFPADYADTYTEVRDCRRSGDHDLNFIRVLAAPDALAPYRDRVDPFPVGAVVLKEEHRNDACTDLVGFTAMRKEEPGFAPATGDWSWQRVDAARTVTEDGTPPRCVSCHTGCGVPPGGYDFTCAEP